MAVEAVDQPRVAVAEQPRAPSRCTTGCTTATFATAAAELAKHPEGVLTELANTAFFS